MHIKVLGSGCANCRALERAVVNTLAAMDIAANVEKVEDIQKIISYGIMRTPGLVIDEKVVLAGRVPSTNELREILAKHAV